MGWTIMYFEGVFKPGWSASKISFPIATISTEPSQDELLHKWSQSGSFVIVALPLIQLCLFFLVISGRGGQRFERLWYQQTSKVYFCKIIDHCWENTQQNHILGSSTVPSHCWQNICGSPQCWEYWQTEIQSSLHWEGYQGGRAWEEMGGDGEAEASLVRGKAGVEAEWRRDCLLSPTGGIIIHTHSLVTPGYCVRGLLLVIIGGPHCFLGHTCSSLVTSQRGFFVPEPTSPLLITAHKPHQLLKDKALIHTTFN